MKKRDKLNRLAKAANYIQGAIDALSEVVEDRSGGFYLCSDAAHYRMELRNLLSCDGGEAGLHQLIAVVNKEVAK